MLKKSVALSLVAVIVSGTLSFAGKGISLEGVKCLMISKRDAKEDKAAEYKKGKVFFCCGNCLGKFEGLSKEQKKELAPKANHQLVATKQYEQGACPFSGGDLNEATKIKVGAAEIAFCCNNCKGKAEKMEEAEQIATLFNDKAFEKAKFKPAEEKAAR